MMPTGDPICPKCGLLAYPSDTGALHQCPGSKEPHQLPASTTIQAQVRAFHDAAGVVTPSIPQIPDDDRIRLRANLVTEEFCEFLLSVYPQFKDMQHGAVLFRLKQAMEYMKPKVDLVAMADALADLDYVVEGTRLICGIDGGPVAEEVHRSNMTKFGPGSWKRDDGKVMKPPDWKPPDIEGVLRRQGM